MTATVQHAPSPDRVRATTWPDVNARLDRQAQLRLRRAAALDDPALAQAIAALDGEWDFDRLVEAEAAVTGLVGLTLALLFDRRLLILPATVSTMLLVHAVHGWYPLLPLLRRLGARSGDEIERERYALKAMRGDFADVPPDGPAAARAAAAWRAVCA